MKLQQLRQFIAVAETLNFHRAAERLNIAQAPLSMAIRRLEADLGARLFERSSHSVSLTDAGTAALEPARSAVFFADQVRRVVTQTEAKESGTLTLQFVPLAMMSFLPRLLVAFRAAYPQIDLTIAESDSRTILKRLERRELDVGVIRNHEPVPPTISFTRVHEDAYLAVLPSHHPKARARRLRLKDLAGDPFIMPSIENSNLYHSMRAACSQAGFEPTVIRAADQLHTMMGMVEKGLGVCLLPEVCRRMAPPTVVVKPLADQVLGATGLGIAHRKDSLSPICRDLLKMAGEVTAPAISADPIPRARRREAGETGLIDFLT